VRASAGALFSLGLAAVAGYAAVAALSWPTKAALFPLVTGIPLLALAVAQLILQLRDPEPPPEPQERGAAAAFAWMAGFIALVVLAGFPTAVPVFVFFYLMAHRAASWWQSIALSAAAWAVFHALFERLLRFPFDGGLVRAWLGLE
jgi:hypothetical protein